MKLALVVASLALAGSASAHNHPTPNAVWTDQGIVVGQTTGQVETFFGIPFATPPVGDLRWQPPQPPAPYGIRDATAFASPCIQNGASSEDCLYLNVWRPKGTGPHDRLPVLVYIYGGGFSGGNGSQFDGTPLASSSKTIFVTLNYRLGALGWMALPSLDEETEDGASSGNYGFLDQVQALRWLKQNIESFGGDKHNVTISGTSAGGISVCMFLAAPLREKLFDKAIMESAECEPSSVFIVSHQAVVAAGVSLAAKLGCTDPATFSSCMRAQPASAILAATAGLGRFTANVGGALVPIHPFDAFTTGQFADVPIMIGANHDEQKGSPLATTGFPGTVAGYQTYLTNTFGLLAPIVAAKYPPEKYGDPAYAAGAAVTDSGAPSGIGFCPMLFEQADALAGTTQVYAYELNDPNAGRLGAFPEGFVVGSEHAAEVKFVYNGYVGTLQPLGIRSDEEAMTRSMLRYWATFLATGKPSDGGMKWPRYRRGAEMVLRFQPDGNVAVSKAVSSDEHNCDFWKGLAY